MLSTRTRSGWGRRMLAHGHAATVDARGGGGGDESSTVGEGGACQRRIQWGWAGSAVQHDEHLVRLERIALPHHITRIVGHHGSDAFKVAYSTTPEGHPGFTSTTFYGGGVPPRESAFTDMRNAYAIEWQNVYLEGNGGTSDDMWGVLYTDCTVYSMSKLHNCIVNQAYKGDARKTIDVDTPVFSIVVPSLTNYYHVMIEVLPKVTFSF